jgi:hypothetical protein
MFWHKSPHFAGPRAPLGSSQGYRANSGIESRTAARKINSAFESDRYLRDRTNIDPCGSTNERGEHQFVGTLRRGYGQFCEGWPLVMWEEAGRRPRSRLVLLVNPRREEASMSKLPLGGDKVGGARRGGGGLR